MVDSNYAIYSMVCMSFLEKAHFISAIGHINYQLLM